MVDTADGERMCSSSFPGKDRGDEDPPLDHPSFLVGRQTAGG